MNRSPAGRSRGVRCRAGTDPAGRRGVAAGPRPVGSACRGRDLPSGMGTIADGRGSMTEYIEIRGARENNLKDVSLRIPKRQITIFTGVSGSGKSSIVFDTIATEAQRQLYENFSLLHPQLPAALPAARGRRDREPEHGGHRRPEAARRRLALRRSARSPTSTPLLRLLFSRRRQAARRLLERVLVQRPAGHVPRVQRPRAGRSASSRTTSSTCRSRSTRARSRCPFWVELGDRRLHGVGLLRQRQEARRLHARGDGPPAVRQGPQVQAADRRQDDERHLPRRHREVRARRTSGATSRRCSERTQKAVEPYLRLRTCPLCKGARLSQAALGSQDRRPQHRRARGDGGRRPDRDPAPDRPTRSPSRSSPALVERLQAMVDIGLDYLSLDRETDTLSGGESQRIKMVKHLGSSLVDVHVHLRRAEHRPPPARRASPERAAPEAARQGQHRDRRRARPGRHQGRRPRRRHGPGRRRRRRARSCSRARSPTSGTPTR